MIDGKRVLAVIPARGGSKRCPRKNIRAFRGKPLFMWSVEAADESRYVDTMVLSTEDAEIKDVAGNRYLVPVIDRPPGLATDTASNEDVMRHALSLYSDHEWVVLLQPTSPLRTAQDIDECVRLAHSYRRTCVSCREDGTRNGAVYVMQSALLERGHNFMTVKKIIWYRMPDERSLDIDEEWQLAS